jgi:MOSC domain-containing protein YiiM
MNARLFSLNAGQPRPLKHLDKSMPSGIVKSFFSGPLWLGWTGLEGDTQADLKNHGEPEKAVCVYPLEHYPHLLDEAADACA